MTVNTDSTGRITKPGDAAEPSKAMAKQPVKPQMVTMLEQMQPEIRRALPSHIKPERMQRVLLSALRSTPKLMECTPSSFFAAVLQAAQLGLEPNTPLGHAWILPYKGQATLQLGYQGMIDLTLRSGRCNSIIAKEVRDGDTFEYEDGLTPLLRHVASGAADRHKRPLTHVYAIARMTQGDPIWIVLTRAECSAARDMSPSKANAMAPWNTHFDAMCLKTAVRRLWKWLPKSSEMATAMVVDDAMETGRSIVNAVDDDVVDVLRSRGIDVTVVDADGVVVQEGTLNE